MNNTTTRNLTLSALILFVTLGAAAWLLRDPGHEDEHTDTHGQEAEEEVAKGPHNGRLLQEGGFALELTIFERGVPPEFHVYAYLDGEPLAPEDYTLGIELARLDGQVDRFNFTPQGDYLRGDGVVVEPHSFDVTVKASHAGRDYQWQYENYEGRTQIAQAMAEQGGIVTEKAGPAGIRETLMLTGRVHTDPERLSKVRARYPGMVRSVRHRQGDTVRAGQVLATVQSNESLQTYALKAPISGLILRSEIQSGEATGDAVLFVIADLSKVWIEFDVFARDIDRVKMGQMIELTSPAGVIAATPITWISPLAAHASQSVRARVAMANPESTLRPGQLVSGQLTIAEHAVPLAVRSSAIQGFRDFQVVFARIGETYEVRMLELGRRDAQWVEVLGGLKPGTEYVTQNSYLIKADIEKSGASHDH